MQGSSAGADVSDACSLQGSDEESDVDDEEREVEKYDRQLADAE